MPTVKESLKILETIRKQKNAFIGALVLSATAPNKKKSDDCISLIQSFGSGLTEFEIEECMQMVEKILGNPYLSPFRTLGGDISLVGDKKPDLPGILD